MIYGVQRTRNWRNIVEILKKSPDFGIHGLTENKLEAILSNSDLFGEGVQRSYVHAHYFAVGKRVKEWPDKEFYDALWASFDIAIPYSGTYSSEKNQAVFSGRPCLLLGVVKPEFRSKTLLVDDRDMMRRLSKYSFKDGTLVKSFPVDHDFNRLFFDLHGFVMPDEELGEIREKLKQFYEKQFFPNDIVSTYFVLNQIIRRMIKKVCKKISSIEL